MDVLLELEVLALEGGDGGSLGVFGGVSLGLVLVVLIQLL